MSEKIEIENVNVPGQFSRVDKTKYEAMKQALLKVLPDQSPGLTHKEILVLLKPILPLALWPDGEKATWWSKTVQLDLEAKRFILRAPESKPLRWFKS